MQKHIDFTIIKLPLVCILGTSEWSTDWVGRSEQREVPARSAPVA
jgi:hypothetical protein